ncbi:MAG: twin-arginine translocation signal domain-containing protein, partial [Planctomycetaceae bacterium]
MSDRQIDSRRGFLKGSAATIAGVSIASGVNMTVARTAHAQGSDMLKVALIGCGGRGNGAVRDSLTASDNTKLVAVADALEDRVTGTARRWRDNDEFKDRVDLPDDRVFWGLDAYKKAIESGV